MRLVLASFLGLWVVGCAHTVTNEQRLDGVTEAVVESASEEAAELRCRDSSPEVQLARDKSQKKAERLARYQWAIADAKSTAARFDEAFRKDPDLVYGPAAGEWKRRQSYCTELVVALERERSRVDIEVVEATPPPAVAEKPAPAPAAAKKTVEVAEKKTSAADEAFEEDTDQLRSKYKKKPKKMASKSKKKRRGVSLAVR